MPLCKLVNTKELLKEIYRLRYHVYYNECGFIKGEDYPSRIEKDKYDAYSLHFIVECSKGIVGTVRMVLDNPYGFPFEEYCRDKLILDIGSLDRSKATEISRLVISKDYGGRTTRKSTNADNGFKKVSQASYAIYRHIYQECKRRGITHCFALMDRTLWVLLNANNIIFEPIGGEIDFYGPVRPYLCRIKRLEEALRKKSPKILKYFLKDLEPQYRPKHKSSFTPS